METYTHMMDAQNIAKLLQAISVRGLHWPATQCALMEYLIRYQGSLIIIITIHLKSAMKEVPQLPEGV